LGYRQADVRADMKGRLTEFAGVSSGPAPQERHLLNARTARRFRPAPYDHDRAAITKLHVCHGIAGLRLPAAKTARPVDGFGQAGEQSRPRIERLCGREPRFG
jgi:hypothetical protein